MRCPFFNKFKFSSHFPTTTIKGCPAVKDYLESGYIIPWPAQVVFETRKQVLGDKIHFAENQYKALENADALIIATEWNEFRTPDFERVSAQLKNKVIYFITYGQMAERSKALVLKTNIFNQYRRFKSYFVLTYVLF